MNNAREQIIFMGVDTMENAKTKKIGDTIFLGEFFCNGGCLIPDLSLLNTYTLGYNKPNFTSTHPHTHTHTHIHTHKVIPRIEVVGGE